MSHRCPNLTTELGGKLTEPAPLYAFVITLIVRDLLYKLGAALKGLVLLCHFYIFPGIFCTNQCDNAAVLFIR